MKEETRLKLDSLEEKLNTVFPYLRNIGAILANIEEIKKAVSSIDRAMVKENTHICHVCLSKIGAHSSFFVRKNSDGDTYLCEDCAITFRIDKPYSNCTICGKRIYHPAGRPKPPDNTDVYCDTCKSSYAGVEIDEPDAGVKNSEQENA